MIIKILYYTATGTEIYSVARAYEALRAECPGLELVVRTADDVFDIRQEERLAELAKNARAVVILPHGGRKSLPGLSRVVSAAKDASIIHVQSLSGSNEDQALVAKYTRQGKILLGGLLNGNFFITIQPPRGHLEKLEELSPEDLNLHDPELSPTHHYLCFYRWLEEVFGAQAVIHVGKHGSLEWLPGKAVALSEECYPDLAIGTLPNIYPYIVNDPGEGTQAKRRSYCAIIDHMIPPQMAAGRYGELAEIAEKIAEWQVIRQENSEKTGPLDCLVRQEFTRVEVPHVSGG
ncbi:cobaltochelatase subunit CobN [Thermodesulfatator autotrophicus]|uniref:CobN/magnesium chelatase domain-containing protein n=1 Tax=Thermodesulfatator autotrophicus TaxID=1795632 RepID=A0A177E737_9BACT|nr:cobaltochelatase subunit CobN [Thermodesulfatator autotrophicus]OAG27754.1 hypothetical protein TH606_05205 [Thermodesulfatator autotrophicus]